MNIYADLKLILEDTPSKEEIAAGKYRSNRVATQTIKGTKGTGFRRTTSPMSGKPIRPEDAPNLSSGSRRVKIQIRKRQGQGLPISGDHGKKRSGRLISSPALQTGTEQDAMVHAAELRRVRRGDRRKGNYGSGYSSRTRGRRSGDTD